MGRLFRLRDGHPALLIHMYFEPQILLCNLRRRRQLRTNLVASDGSPSSRSPSWSTIVGCSPIFDNKLFLPLVPSMGTWGSDTCHARSIAADLGMGIKRCDSPEFCMPGQVGCHSQNLDHWPTYLSRDTLVLTHLIFSLSKSQRFGSHLSRPVDYLPGLLVLVGN